VLVDRKGLPKQAQKCTDNDPTCDFDPVAGKCQLRVWACFGGADARLACGATQVGTIELRSPKLTALGNDLAARTALLNAFSALDLPAGPGEECTGRVAVDVATGKKLKLKTKARFGPELRSDSDSLTLSCAAP